MAGNLVSSLSMPSTNSAREVELLIQGLHDIPLFSQELLLNSTAVSNSTILYYIPIILPKNLSALWCMDTS